MKKFAFAAAVMALLTVFAVSCKKDKAPKEDTKPVITWEANSDFSSKQINDQLDARVSVTAQEGVEALTIKFTKLPTTMIGKVSSNISITENWQGSNANTPVLDLVADSKAITYARGLKVIGTTNLFGATTVTLDFLPLVNDLMLEWTTKETIEILLTVKDKENQTASQKLTFLYTPAPVIVWSTNSTSLIIGANSTLKATVTAYGLITTAALTLDTSNAEILSDLNIYGTTSGSKLTIDLSGTSAATGYAASDLGLATGSKIVGKERVTITLDKVLDKMYRRLNTTTAASAHTIILSVTDDNGKTTESQMEISFFPAV